MATLAEFLFEGAAGDGFNVTVGGGGVIDTVVFYQGAQSYYLDCTGASKGHNYTVAAGKRIIVGRFYYRIKTDTSGTATIIQGDNTSGSCQISARVGRKLRVQVVGGTASVDSAALNLNQWYRIDFKFDTSGGTTTIVWQIDGVAQTGASRVQTAADTTSIRLGNTGTNTYQNNFDAFKITDQAADYPLGPLVWAVPTTLALTTAGFAPSVSATNHQGVTPSTKALTLATFAPTVSVSNHQTVTPGVASLATATFAPTVSTTNHQVVTPGVAALTLASFAPTVTATAHQTVTPTTLALTTTTFAPVPALSDNQAVTPDAASLVTSTFAPDVTASNHQVVTPDTASLTLTTFAPTTTGEQHVTVTPDVAMLVTTNFEPTVSAIADTNVVPDTASLVLTTFASTVDVTQHITVTPDTRTLTLSPYAPTVTATGVAVEETRGGTVGIPDFRVAPQPRPRTVRPRPAHLRLRTFAPVISATTFDHEDAQAVLLLL